MNNLCVQKYHSTDISLAAAVKRRTRSGIALKILVASLQ